MAGRKWLNIHTEKSQDIISHLLQMGGMEKPVSSEIELWRARFSDSTFTYYKSGTLYSTPSNSKDPVVEDAWRYIDKIVDSIFIEPTKDFIIGLDETGKGELAGHTHLVGALIPSVLFEDIKNLVSVADTKKFHTFEYWDELFKKLSEFRSKQLVFIEEKIPPWHVDKYNLNKIMDVVYQRILASFFRKVDVSKCRIVIDDYGIGPTLKRFLNFLERKKTEVIVAQKSDDTYLEARVASVIAKRGREAVLKAINENPEYKINKMSIGSGNAGDGKTIGWLKSWHASGKGWPWFIKRSFSTIRKIEGLVGKAKKITPPIRENLLSEEFKKNLGEGKLDIRVLSVVCPSCGSILKAVLFTAGDNGFTSRCPDCKKPIIDLNFTLRYYCGFIVPDSNVINRGLLGKDLDRGKFFEDFVFLIPGVVRFECDTPGGKKEFERLARFASMGRIKLRETGIFDPKKFENLSSQEKDDIIMQACVEEHAILLSADNQVKGLAVSKDIFTVFVR